MKITKENYEQWMLDAIEGRLLPAQELALQTFLREHPELEGPDPSLSGYTLRAQQATQDWSSLKKAAPAAPATPEEMDHFLLRASDNLLSPEEEVLLMQLVKDPAHAARLQHFQSLKLQPTHAAMPTDKLYRLGLDQALSAHTFDSYLSAYSEGLLLPHQVRALETYAAQVPQGTLQLRAAARLRLNAPRGIFFPDKASLYRQEDKKTLRPYLWGAAAAALIALTLTVLRPPAEPAHYARRVPVAVEPLHTPIQAPRDAGAQPQSPDSLKAPTLAPTTPSQAEQMLPGEPALADQPATQSEDMQPLKPAADTSVTRPAGLRPAPTADAPLLASTPELPATLPTPEAGLRLETASYPSATRDAYATSGSQTYSSVLELAEHTLARKLKVPQPTEGTLVRSLLQKAETGLEQSINASIDTQRYPEQERNKFALRIGQYSLTLISNN